MARKTHGGFPKVSQEQKQFARNLADKVADTASNYDHVFSDSLLATLRGASQTIKTMAETRMEEHALELILCNVDNEKMSDAEFRDFIRASWQDKA